MMIISAWWLQTSSKFTWEEVKRQPQSLEYDQILREAGEDDSSKIKATQSLLCEWNINTDQSINHMKIQSQLVI